MVEYSPLDPINKQRQLSNATMHLRQNTSTSVKRWKEKFVIVETYFWTPWDSFRVLCATRDMRDFFQYISDDNLADGLLSF